MTNKLRSCDWCNKNNDGENPGFVEDTEDGLWYMCFVCEGEAMIIDKKYSMPTLEEKKAYYDSVKASNYQASLRLEGFSVENKEIDLLTSCGYINLNDGIISEDLSKLPLDKEDKGSWVDWIVKQIKEDSVQSYKEWYDRMFLRTNGNLHPDLIKAHNELFGES